MNYSLKPKLAALLSLTALLSFSAIAPEAKADGPTPHTGEVTAYFAYTGPYQIPTVRERQYVDNYQVNAQEYNVYDYDDGFGLDKALSRLRQTIQYNARSLCDYRWIRTNSRVIVANGLEPGSFRLPSVTITGNLFSAPVVINCNNGGISAPNNHTKRLDDSIGVLSPSSPLNDLSATLGQ